MQAKEIKNFGCNWCCFQSIYKFIFLSQHVVTLGQGQSCHCKQWTALILTCIMVKSSGTTLLSTTGPREPSARAPLSWTTPMTLRPQLPSDRPPLQLRLRAHPQRPPMASGQEFRPQTTATAGPPTPPWPTRMAATGWRQRRSPWPSRGWRRRCPPWREPPPRSETVSPCWRRTWHNWRLPLLEVWKAVWSSDVLFFYQKKKHVLLKVRQSVVWNKRAGANSKSKRLFLNIHLSVLQPLPRSSKNEQSQGPPRKLLKIITSIRLPVSRCWLSIMILSEELLLTHTKYT